jgi:hypothetical protein
VCLGLTDGVAGSRVGAISGSAAIFIGSSLDKLSACWDSRKALEDRAQGIAKLVTSELGNVAAGLMGSHTFLRQCVAAHSGGVSAELRTYLPRSMPLTTGLGAELLNLNAKQIDVLATLFGNMKITHDNFCNLIDLGKSFTLLDVMKLKEAVAADMLILAEAFDHFAPTRKFLLPDKEPQLVAALLRAEAAR